MCNGTTWFLHALFLVPGTCLDFTLIATRYITGMFVQLMTYK